MGMVEATDTAWVTWGVKMNRDFTKPDVLATLLIGLGSVSQLNVTKFIEVWTAAVGVYKADNALKCMDNPDELTRLMDTGRTTLSVYLAVKRQPTEWTGKVADYGAKIIELADMTVLGSTTGDTKPEESLKGMLAKHGEEVFDKQMGHCKEMVTNLNKISGGSKDPGVKWTADMPNDADKATIVAKFDETLLDVDGTALDKAEGALALVATFTLLIIFVLSNTYSY
jgi:hypothetical protein